MKFMAVRNVSVPFDGWLDPPKGDHSYAWMDTPKGRVFLFRERSKSNSFESIAFRFEDWRVVMNDEVKISISGMGAPDHLSKNRLAVGVDGEICGIPCGVKFNGAFFSKRRFVEFELQDSRSLKFRPQGPRVLLEDEFGQELAQCSSGEWDIATAGELEFFAVCLFELGGFKSLLGSPLAAIF